MSARSFTLKESKLSGYYLVCIQTDDKQRLSLVWIWTGLNRLLIDLDKPHKPCIV